MTKFEIKMSEMGFPCQNLIYSRLRVEAQIDALEDLPTDALMTDVPEIAGGGGGGTEKSLGGRGY